MANIDDVDRVIKRLGEIVDWAKAEPSRTGFFAALYRNVTIDVKKGIQDGRFDNPDLMTDLDVVFAHRYLDAFDEWRHQRSTTGAWKAAFDAATQWRPLIVQQLLVGINAHINLDLGIAAATVTPGDRIDDLKPDFFEINALLGTLVRGVVEDIGEVSPWIGWLDRIGGRTEDRIIEFSIDIARDEAWKLARTLAPLPQDRWPPDVDKRDVWTSDFAGFLLRPGWLLSSGLLLIRARESNDIPHIIDVLGH